MPYQIQPYNYQSTFVPTDLGVIQRGLEQRQGRYDSANQAWAQTKMALYDDPSYDPSVKEEVVKKVEGNFDNLYKSYNGDMGAAVSDLTQMIGGIRKDPYFSLNKVALEKQKEYEALKKAYGAKGIEFKGMPKGLRDPNNNNKLRSQEEFSPEVLMDSGMDEKLASIVKQSMVDASTEGGLSKVPGREGLLQSVTKYGPGHGQAGKAESIYKEYLQTPEGQLRLRMLTEGAKFGGKQYDKVENPEEALKAIVNQAIANRVAESTKIDRMADPSYTKPTTTGDGKIPQEPFTIPIGSTVQDDPNKTASTPEQRAEALRTTLNRGMANLTPQEKNQMYIRGNAVLRNPEMNAQYNAIIQRMNELEFKPGIGKHRYFTQVPNVSNDMDLAYFENSNEQSESSTGRVSRIGDKKVSKEKAKQILALRRMVNEYNAKYENVFANQTIDPATLGDPQMNYQAIHPGFTKENTALQNFYKNSVPKADFEFISGGFAGKKAKDLEKDDAFKASEFTSMGYAFNPWTGMTEMVKDNKTGTEHEIKHKNKAAGVAVAGLYNDREAAIAEQYRDWIFSDSDNSFAINREGSVERKKLPKGVTTHFEVGEDGHEYLRLEENGKSASVGQYYEPGNPKAEEFLDKQLKYYLGSGAIGHREPETLSFILSKPVRYGNKEEVIKTLKLQ